jgi:hypothetical protein
MSGQRLLALVALGRPGRSVHRSRHALARMYREPRPRQFAERAVAPQRHRRHSILSPETDPRTGSGGRRRSAPRVRMPAARRVSACRGADATRPRQGDLLPGWGENWVRFWYVDGCARYSCTHCVTWLGPSPGRTKSSSLLTWPTGHSDSNRCGRALIGFSSNSTSRLGTTPRRCDGTRVTGSSCVANSACCPLSG